MEKIMIFVFICCSISCSNMGSENRNIFYDFDDFEVAGKDTQFRIFKYPRIEELESSDNYKKFDFQYKKNENIILEFSHKEGSWINERESRYAEFDLIVKTIISKNVIYQVNYNKENNIIFWITKRSKGENTVKHFLYEVSKVKYDNTHLIDNLTLKNDRILEEEFKFSNKQISVKVSDFKKKETDVYFYKSKHYTSIFLFGLDQNRIMIK